MRQKFQIEYVKPGTIIPNDLNRTQQKFNDVGRSWMVFENREVKYFSRLS